MAEVGIIWTLLLSDLGFFIDLNVDPKRSIYLRIGGMVIIIETSFIFKILQPKLKSFTSLQRTCSREYDVLGLKQGCPTFLTECPSRFCVLIRGPDV
jgi:hypothetical protein